MSEKVGMTIFGLLLGLVIYGLSRIHPLLGVLLFWWYLPFWMIYIGMWK